LLAGEPTQGGDTLPPPRRLPPLGEDSVRAPNPDLERLLTQLKTEREGLDADWKSYAKQRSEFRISSLQEQKNVEELLLKVLDRLRQREQQKSIRVPLPKLDAGTKKAEPLEAKGSDSARLPKEAAVPDDASAIGVDPLHLGNALFRLEKFAEALASYRKVDLKAKAAEERAPLQFLMASCLLRLGKNTEAIELLRDVANSRSDERTAGYAQWELDMQRWQREAIERLEDMRRRRLATERQP
jgi:tetratricopeptide (TPR) repeat protein